jgi:CheY-like chemotaxis protein
VSQKGHPDTDYPAEKIEWTLKVLPDCADNRFGGTTVLATRVLLVDDDEVVRMTLSGVLEQSGFAITSSANVPEALRPICGTESYDVVLSDLHMPGAGGGLTVGSAMRHANPSAATLLLTAFSEMTAVAEAILQQTDEVLVKPLVDVIRPRVARGPQQKRVIESVASVLGRERTSTIRAWHDLGRSPNRLARPRMVTSSPGFQSWGQTS